MIITAETKISALIKANPAAIDAIASINSHFNKLHNPIFRKILASRVTIAEAAKIGKVDIALFFEKLKPLGFLPEYKAINTTKIDSRQRLSQGNYEAILDVRSDIASGTDPFTKILSTLKGMKAGATLLLVNSFEPVPLIRILEAKNYITSVFNISSEEIHTYIKKTGDDLPEKKITATGDPLFDNVLREYEGRLIKIDVRALPMPQPMMMILKHLTTLPLDTALFVFHKKVPLFLLPELADRNFSHVLRHINGEVELIIYRQTQ